MKYFAAVCLLCLGISLVPAAHASILAEIDVFPDGSTINWTNENPNTAMPAMNIGPGALGGLEDKSPEIIANGTGVDDRLTTFNRAQSLRDYFPAGVTGRGVVALALLGAFLLWCVRAFPTVLATAWNFFRPLNPPRPPPSSRT